MSSAGVRRVRGGAVFRSEDQRVRDAALQPVLHVSEQELSRARGAAAAGGMERQQQPESSPALSSRQRHLPGRLRIFPPLAQSARLERDRRRYVMMSHPCDVTSAA